MQDGSSKERIDHNNPENDVFVEDIINDQVCRIMEDGGDVELVAYNQLRCDRAKSASIQEIVSLESKYEFRTVAEELGLPVLETHLLPECDSIMDHLRMTHGDGAYVIQNDESSGGDGTFVIDASNARCVESELNRRSGRWIYSRHLKGAVSVNVHLIISDEEVFLTPGSVQICRLIGNRILYRGADFVAYSSLDPEMRCYFDRCARIMGEEIQRRGYRGVAGIDAIFHEGKVALVEANLRYQASTILLNKAMLDASRNDSEWAGVSMHRLNSLARDHKRLSDTISEGKLAGLRVGYSLYTYIAEGDRRGCSGSERENESISLQSRHIFDRLMRMSGCDSDVLRVRQDEWAPESPNGHGSEYVPPNVKSMTLITDGFDGSNECGPYGYLFKVIINRRILTEGTFEVSPEFSEPEWLAEDLTDPIKLKIALINQGIRVTENVKRDHAFAVNNAIDIKVTLDEGKELWINCPCTDYNVGLSPFELSEMGSGELGITYYGVPLSVKAEWVPESNPGGRNFDVGRGYREDDICVITTDRLRVQQTSRCKFQVMGRPCTFCEVSLDGSPFVDRGHDPLSDFGIEDILSVLSDRLKRNLPDENGHRPLFRHILIGGKTCQSDSQTMEYVDRICDLIRSMSGGEPYDIYLMCTPISSLEDLTALRDMGVVRIGFNKDVIGDSKSAQYTPGKGGLGQDKYLEALKNAVSVFGIGKVYSAMVLGLESPEVYLGWAEQLIDIGAIPILSAYRPVPGTDAAMCGPAIPTNGLLYKVFNHITNCGKGHGGFSDEGAFFADIAPGPSCDACQNNTISLPWTWVEG